MPRMAHGDDFDLVFGILIGTREDPDVSNRKLAERLESTHPTVGYWRRALEGPERDELVSELIAAGYPV
jgi:hypothetical protein